METQMTAEIREAVGKSSIHQLREVGRIPAVLYGAGLKPRTLSVDAKEFGRLYSQGLLQRLIRLNIIGGERPEAAMVLIKEVQREPLGQKPIHLDFNAVLMDHSVDVRVPIHLTGGAQRALDGAIIESHMHEIEITCLPAAIPDRLNLDVSGLKIGQSLLVKDVPVPQGVTVRSHPEDTVVSAAVPVKPVETEVAVPVEPQPATAKKVKEE